VHVGDHTDDTIVKEDSDVNIPFQFQFSPAPFGAHMTQECHTVAFMLPRKYR